MGLKSLALSMSSLNFNAYIYIIYCMIFLHASFPATIATSRRVGNETDQLALLEFKAKITKDPFKVLGSWNESVHFCEWRGVSCGRRHQRVTLLDLQSQKLEGSLSPHIGNLSFLRELNLQNNSFSSIIPLELGRLKRLEFLIMKNNSIEGEIPDNISNCSNLKTFDVYNNRLVGKIPKELGSLLKLQIFVAGRNNLGGVIPHSFGNLSSLQKFYTSFNNLVGEIPQAVCKLNNLIYLAVSDNGLFGSIPSSLFNHSSIMGIDVGGNQIQGSLPVEFGNTLPNLQFLSIGSNQITGSIPTSISNASNLVFLTTGENNLTGKVPTFERLNKLERLYIGHASLGSGEVDDLSFLSSLVNCTNLAVISLDRNNFGGVLPESIANLSKTLRRLTLSYNQVKGNIPVGIGKLVKLEALYLGANQLTGNIPTDIGKLQNLKELDIPINELSGTIPSSLGNLTFLSELGLGENYLHGNIPSSLGNCQNLVALDLSYNNLSGEIPPKLFGISSLSLYLILSWNHLKGSIPLEVGDLKNLGLLDVSKNELSGDIPITLGSCERLETLYLQSNFFKGTIPSSLQLARGVQFLDLSHNNLSGKIPEYMVEFKALQYLNLSYNDFEGEVPIKGVFGNLSTFSVMGNSKLCGGIIDLHMPMCFSHSKKRRSKFTLKLVIPLFCGLFVVTLVLSFLYIHCLRKKRKLISSSSEEDLLLRVSYQSLFNATNGFSSENLIGAGSFGSVYKGILDHDGIVVAVKVLKLSHQGASSSFVAECKVLRNIRHRNLIKVVSVCSSVDYQNNDFKALVYEFMVNGNLDEWLHPVSGENEEPRKLSLVQRLNVAIDVACALDYLHHQCEIPIIHCDLKPSNVLLDNEMVAHVGDFGLSRFLLDTNSNTSSVNQASSIGIKGTIGYAAPEYGIGSEVSTYGDMYSYGILLLEMFTGKRPSNDMFIDSLNLHNYTKMALPERVLEIVDPIFLDSQSHFSSLKLEECLISIFGIGISCSAESPSERMDVNEVVAKLSVIKKNLLRIDRTR